MRQIIYLHRLAGDAFHLLTARAVVISYTCAVVYIVVIDHSGLADVRPVIRWPPPVVEAIPAVHISRLHKYPPAFRAVIAHGNTNTWTQWSPAAIAVAITPAYPCRRPFIAGYPYPAIVGVVGPAAIVINRPAPRVIRHPRITVVGHGPVTAAAIRAEVALFVRHPYIAIIRVVYPLTVRGKIIIKHLERYGHILGMGPLSNIYHQQHAE
ncbi:MAG: hypothetical protein K0Q79_1421 [Flavipsychrobacter sp.]|nr:hypothetical protein [Flavipsychrobacter sp.]